MGKETKSLTIAEVIKRRKADLAFQREYRSLFLKMIVIIAACWIVFTQIFLLMQVKGNGMFPSVKDGDLVLAFRLQQEYAKNDVVVFTTEGKTYVGRIVARENDVVTLDESGTLLVNGTVQSGEILYPSYAEGDLEYPYLVPEGHVFVMGDYRTQTTDSRNLGPIAMEDVKGKVITILRRRGL